MKEKIQIELSNPCHESWDAMTLTEQGRHCGSCCKTVVDFTTMTDREIIDYISHYATGNTCARVHDNQLNRLMQTPPERRLSWKYFWSIALSSLLVSYRSLAQVRPPKNPPAMITGMNETDKKQPIIRLGGITASHVKDTITTTVSGRVLNEQGIPVPFASITLNNPVKVFMADEEGKYSFSIRSEQVRFTEMTISAVGYEPYTYATIHVDSIKSIEIIKKTVHISMKDFEMKQRMMKEVVVNGYPTTCLQGMAGGIGTFVRVSKIQKLKAKAVEIIHRKDSSNDNHRDIAIYPNPAPVNGSFVIRFNLKQTGEYNVQFIDVAGRIVGGRQVMIAAPGQTETFTGGHLPRPGAYFVRVAGRNDAKVYNAKLVTQ